MGELVDGESGVSTRVHPRKFLGAMGGLKVPLSDDVAEDPEVGLTRGRGAIGDIDLRFRGTTLLGPTLLGPLVSESERVPNCVGRPKPKASDGLSDDIDD